MGLFKLIEEQALEIESQWRVPIFSIGCRVAHGAGLLFVLYALQQTWFNTAHTEAVDASVIAKSPP